MATMAIDEAKNPSKIVPQAILISIVIVTSLYSLAGASLSYLRPPPPKIDYFEKTIKIEFLL